MQSEGKWPRAALKIYVTLNCIDFKILRIEYDILCIDFCDAAKLSHNTGHLVISHMLHIRNMLGFWVGYL